MKNALIILILFSGFLSSAQSLKCYGGTIGTSGSDGGYVEWLPEKSLTKRWYATIDIQDYRTGQYWQVAKYTNTDNSNRLNITQLQVINLAKSVDVSYTWPQVLKNCIDSANMRVKAKVNIYREKWSVGSGWIFDLYSGTTSVNIYINMLELYPQYLCDSTIMFLDYPTTINYDLDGLYTIKRRGTIVKTTIQNRAYYVALDTGAHTLNFKTNVGGCTFERTNNVKVVNPPTIIHSSTPLPDTMLSSSASISLSNYYSHTGNELHSNSIGTQYNPNLKFAPLIANTGNNIIEIYSVDTTSGCETVIYDTIYVKHDPGVPSPAFIDYYTTGFHNVQIQGKWVLDPPTMFSPPGNTYYKFYYHYKELNICDGDKRTWFLRHPKTGFTDLTKNLTYTWYLSHSSGTDTLGAGISKQITIPDNGLNDRVRLLIVSENYLGTKSVYTQVIDTWKNPKMRVEPELTNCYLKNDTIKMYKQWHNFRQSDTNYIRVSNLFDSSAKINLVSSSNLPVGSDNSLINVSTNKYENNIFSLKYEYPYYRHISSTFPYTQTDSILYGITGAVPSTPTDSIHVWANKLSSIIDTCVCKNIDTVVSINNPIPDYFLSYLFPSDSIVKHGDLMRYINTSSFGNSYSWDFHNGDYSYRFNADQYIYEAGWHGLTLTASDTINFCFMDSVNLKLFRAENVLGIEESKNIVSAEIYPNPFISSFTLKVNSNKNEEVEMLIYDLSGKLVTYQKTSLVPGVNQIKIDLEGQTTAQYLVKLKGETTTLTFKIIKQ